MIKSGSQVLGKGRQRPQVTRGQLLKGLHDNEEKISQLVEAAHAVRCTSNEKHSSTKKPNISVSDMWARINTAQNFGEKYSNH